MADKAQAFKIPEPPQITHPGHPGIPENIREEWRRLYAQEYERGFAKAAKKVEAEIGRVPLDPVKRAAYIASFVPARTLSSLHQAARIEANKLLSVPAPQSYAEAIALPQWQLLVRRERDAAGDATGRRLTGVTIDGNKFSFAVPAKAAAA